MKQFCENFENQKSIYDDFVRDLRQSNNVPILRNPDEYNNQSVAMFSCTQHSKVVNCEEIITPQIQKKITQQWCDFFLNNELPLHEVQFCTKTPQNILNAVTKQKSITSLRFKWLSCNNINAISSMKSLKRLFIECGPKIESIVPISELDNLEVLILGSTTKIIDYSAIAKLKKLRVLGICSYQTRDDIIRIKADDFIGQLKSLKYLELSDAKFDEINYLSYENLRNFDYYCFNA